MDKKLTVFKVEYWLFLYGITKQHGQKKAQDKWVERLCLPQPWGGECREISHYCPRRMGTTGIYNWNKSINKSNTETLLFSLFIEASSWENSHLVS